MSLEDKIKQITLNNLEKSCKFIIVKDEDNYYLYCNEKESYREIFKDFKKIMKKGECKGGGMVLLSKERKELMLYGMSGYYGKFPVDIVKKLILEYVKDTEFKDYNIIVD